MPRQPGSPTILWGASTTTLLASQPKWLLHSTVHWRSLTLSTVHSFGQHNVKRAQNYEQACPTHSLQWTCGPAHSTANPYSMASQQWIFHTEQPGQVPGTHPLLSNNQTSVCDWLEFKLWKITACIFIHQKHTVLWTEKKMCPHAFHFDKVIWEWAWRFLKINK